MTKPISISVDFYQISLPIPLSFHSILTELANANRPLHGTRDGQPVKLEHLQFYPLAQRWDGDLTKIRMNNIPRKASLRRPPQDLDFLDDEGLGWESAFIYHVPTNTLVLQRNRFGVGASTFTWLIQTLTGIEAVTFDPVIAERAVDELLERQKSFRKLDVRVAGMKNMEVLQGIPGPQRHIMELARELEAPSIEVVFSMQYTKGSLNRANAYSLIRNLFRLHGSGAASLQTATIHAMEDEHERAEVLDLLEARIVESVEIRPGRHVERKDRLQAVIEAWRRRQAEIERIYGPPRV